MQSMDEFSSVLQHLSSLHTAQVQALSAQLEEEQRMRRDLEEKIEALRKANDNARKNVEQAKKKVRQQAKHIKELEKKLQNNGQEEHTSALYGEPSSPAAAAAGGADHPSHTANTDTHRLNQTCATLFESPMPVNGSKVSMSKETPVRSVSGMREEEESFQKGSGEEERERGGETMDYHRGESIETVAGDVIILDDDVTGNNHPAPVRPLSKSAVDSDCERMKQSISITSEGLQSSLPPSGPVHMVYSHAHAYSSDIHPYGEENEQSPKKTTTCTRPLSLRDVGASKVKWRELSSTSLASTSATSSNSSDTKASPDKTDSPGNGNESEGTSASSSPEQGSPSLLGASNSPWKLQQSNSSSSRQMQQSSSTSTPVNMTRSLFARTPAANHGSVAVTTPVSMLKSAIPPSDSQFSLDVSQSAPLSPELCPLTTPTQKPHPPLQAIPAGSANLKPPSKSTLIPSGSVDCSVVPITPGVPSVNKILKGRKRWMRIDDQSPASEKIAAAVASYDEQTSVRNFTSGGKRGQEQVDFEDEDILPQSKVHRLASMNDTAPSHTVYDDHTRLEYEPVMDSSEEEEGGDSPMSPILIYPKNAARATTVAVISRSSDTSVSSVQGQGMANCQSYGSAPRKPDHQRMLERAGLPTGYKFEAPIRKKADRDKLEGKACPDCQAWFSGDDGIHGNVEDHLRQACRHKHLHLPPDEDSRIWNISFPSTEECENIMNGR